MKNDKIFLNSILMHFSEVEFLLKKNEKYVKMRKIKTEVEVSWIYLRNILKIYVFFGLYQTCKLKKNNFEIKKKTEKHVK